jgi:hypothetical protein
MFHMWELDLERRIRYFDEVDRDRNTIYRQPPNDDVDDKWQPEHEEEHPMEVDGGNDIPGEEVWDDSDDFSGSVTYWVM